MFLYCYRVCYSCHEYCLPKDARVHELCNLIINCLFPLPARPLFFSFIGELLGIMFRLWSMIFRSTLVIFACCHANTQKNYVRSATSWALVFSVRSAPIFIGCSRWPLCITCFSNGWSALDFLGALTKSDAATIWWHICMRGVLASIISDPDYMLNLNIPWIFDGTACSSKSVGRSNNMFCSGRWRIIKNLMIYIPLSLPSWLTNMSGRCIVPSGHRLCPVKPTKVPPAGGFKFSFQESGNYRKQCLYGMSVLLPLSM